MKVNFQIIRFDDECARTFRPRTRNRYKESNEFPVYVFRMNADEASLAPATASKVKKQQQRLAATQKRTRSIHETTVYMFLAIVVVYVVCTLSLVLNIVLSYGRIVTYIYFLNHVCNPFVYYAINRNFRDDMNQLMRRVKQLFRK